MTPTDRTLDALLTLVRENPPAGPLVPPVDIEDALHQVDQAAGDLTRRTPIIIPTWRIIMSLVIVALIGGLLFWNDRTNPAATAPVAATSPLVASYVADVERGLPGSFDGITVSGRLGCIPPPAPFSLDPRPFRSDAPERTVPTDKTPPAAPVVTHDMPGLVITDLTPEELKRMGIIFRDGRIVIEQTEPVPTSSVPSGDLEMCRQLGYDLTAPTLPFRVRTTFSLRLGEQSTTAIPLAPSNEPVAITPVATTMFDAAGSSRALTGSGPAEDLLGGGGMALLGREIGALRKEGTQSFALLEQFVAVRMTYTAKESDGTEREREVYLWYLPTADLRDALPARYRDAGFAERMSALRAVAATAPTPSMKDIPFPGLIVLKHSNEYGSLWELDKTRDIDGIRMFELTDRELERIGITRSGAGYGFGLCQRMIGPMKDSWSNTLDSLGYGDDAAPALGFACSVDTFSFNYAPVAKGRFTPGSPLPVIFSSRWIHGPNDGVENTNGLSMIFTTEAPDLDSLRGGSDELRGSVDDLYKIDQEDPSGESTALNGLVPVRVTLKSDEYVDSAKEYRGAEILFWFVPTYAFVDALPERYAVPLRAELDAISAVRRDGLPPSELCNRTAGERPFLDICRSAAGAVTATALFPNPVRTAEQVTVSFDLSAPRSVTIELHDLSGRFLRELRRSTPAPAGENEATLPLDNVAQGTYLITVRTDEGETAVQRVVVR